jgi:hypothetical protein
MGVCFCGGEVIKINRGSIAGRYACASVQGGKEQQYARRLPVDDQPVIFVGGRELLVAFRTIRGH